MCGLRPPAGVRGARGGLGIQGCWKIKDAGRLESKDAGRGERLEMTIEDWRDEIDRIDDELLRLLNERARLAVRVGELKRLAGLSVFDLVREREVITRVCQSNTGPLAAQGVARIFRRIIRESRRVRAQAIEQQDAQPEGIAR